MTPPMPHEGHATVEYWADLRDEHCPTPAHEAARMFARSLRELARRATPEPSEAMVVAAHEAFQREERRGTGYRARLTAAIAAALAAQEGAQ